MRIEKVSYQKAFVIGPYLQERVGFEMQVDDGQDPLEVLAEAKKLAEKFHIENNPHVGESVTYFTPIKPEPIIPDAKTDAEYAELIKKLNKFKTKEDALLYLSTTNWKHTIEAKQFINTKFSNNGKVNQKQK